jgi:hypothetical protein
MLADNELFPSLSENPSKRGALLRCSICSWSCHLCHYALVFILKPLRINFKLPNLALSCHLQMYILKFEFRWKAEDHSTSKQLTCTVACKTGFPSCGNFIALLD